MKNTWIKMVTASTVIGATLVTANLSADEPVLVTPDKKDATKLKLTGRVQFQVGFVDQENDNGSDDWSTMEVRRARIGASGAFPNDIKAKVEANVKPSDVSVRSAKLTWAKHDAYNVSVGFDKPISSMEEDTSSSSILTVERSNVNNNITAPGESTGLWVSGESGIAFYHIGLYNGEGVDSSRNTSNEDAEYMFNAHGGVTVALSEDSEITAMVSYLETDDPNSELGYDDTTAVAVHFEAGAIDVRAEYFMGTEGDEDTTGFYIMPSMMLNESLEAVARFEVAESDAADGIRAQSRYARRTELADDADRGDDFQALYLGVNCYFQKYNKVMFGIEFSELDNTDAGTLESTTLFGAYRTRF